MVVADGAGQQLVQHPLLVADAHPLDNRHAVLAKGAGGGQQGQPTAGNRATEIDRARQVFRIVAPGQQAADLDLGATVDDQPDAAVLVVLQQQR